MAETRIRLDKQIQKAPASSMIPLSDVNGELQFSALNALIKSGETITRLDSVEVVGGNLVIKYTAEDGIQQVVSTAMNFSQTDINVADAKLENPSAGVYRLLITESDGTTYPVDLSALLAIVAQNTTYTTLTGNGTPQNPLKVDLNQAFWNMIPRQLDAMDDVDVRDTVIETEVQKGGNIVLVFDTNSGQWTAKSTNNLEPFTEVTETFRDLNAGNTVGLQYAIEKIIPGSIKVYRNGLRLEEGMDYALIAQSSQKLIQFMEPFTQQFAEKVTVDYRPLPAFLVAA